MSDSNCNCCCQYSTPPWWVTMGYVAPANYTGQTQIPVQTAVPTNPGTVRPGTPAGPFKPGSVFGDVLGQTGGAVGNAVGSVLGTPLNIAGGILGSVANGVGSLLGKLF